MGSLDSQNLAKNALTEDDNAGTRHHNCGALVPLT